MPPQCVFFQAHRYDTCFQRVYAGSGSLLDVLSPLWSLFYNNKAMKQRQVYMYTAHCSLLLLWWHGIVTLSKYYFIWFDQASSHNLVINGFKLKALKLIKVHMKYKPLFTGHRKCRAVSFLIKQFELLHPLALLHFRWACLCCQFKSARIQCSGQRVDTEFGPRAHCRHWQRHRHTGRPMCHYVY